MKFKDGQQRNIVETDWDPIPLAYSYDEARRGLLLLGAVAVAGSRCRGAR